MSKGREEASYWVTFVDMKNKKVLLTKRMLGKAVGFGFRNYWAGSAKNVFKAMKKEFKNWELKLQIAMPHIEAALGSFTKAVKFKNDYLTYLKDPGTFCYSNLITVVCFKK